MAALPVEAVRQWANIGRRTPRWVARFTLLLLASTAVAPAANQAAERPGAGVLPAPDAPLTQYRAFRRMHVRSEKFNQEAWLEAWTELDHGGFRYEIVSERGSDYSRNKVLKMLLKREQEIVADGPARAALTDANYVFTESEGPGDGLRYVLMKPKRKDVVLVDGRMVLTENGADLLRIEGRLSKNPSFWTSMVNVIRHFATVDGVRVPTSTETIAKVKFAGQSHMEVSYEYESINGRPITLAARHVLAPTVAGGSR